MYAYKIAGLFAGAVLLGGTASAADMHISRSVYGEVRQLAVHAGDLDLARADGAQELLSRLEFAAVRVCDAETTERDLKMYALHRACVKDTMERAVSSVPSPLVKTLYVSSEAE